jgi:hypothetical protein
MRMSSRIVVLLLAGGVALSAQSASKSLPPPFHTPSADNRSQVIPQPAGARL